MTKLTCVFASTVLLAVVMPLPAREPDDPVAQLKARVEKLEAENAAIKKELTELKVQLITLRGRPKGGSESKRKSEAELVLQAGNEFMKDLEKNRKASAYRSTSVAFQKRTDRKAFDELIDKQSALKNLVDRESLRESKVKELRKENAYEFYFTCPDLNGFYLGSQLVNVTLQLIQEDGEWKVDKMEIDVSKR